jgi:hypothetical protein
MGTVETLISAPVPSSPAGFQLYKQPLLVSNKEVFLSKEVRSMLELMTFDASKNVEFTLPSKLYTVKTWKRVYGQGNCWI